MLRVTVEGNLKTGAKMTCRTPVEPPVEPLSNPVCCTPLIPPAGYTACPPGWRAAACRGWTEDTRGEKRNGHPRCCWNALRRAEETTRHAKGNASAACYSGFSPILKRIAHARPHGRGLASIEPELTWPGMWRVVRLPEGYLTDMVNLSRVTDAAASLALAVLNRHREAA
jgi:hypothetical protein